MLNTISLVTKVQRERERENEREKERERQTERQREGFGNLIFIITLFQGSFQQMWISKQEYDEGGKNCVERKCP